MEVLMLNEDFLTEHLSGESKKKFLEFCNAWGVVNGESNLDSFIIGFRLGANFTYDTFVSEESPFTDLLSPLQKALLIRRKERYNMKAGVLHGNEDIRNLPRRRMGTYRPLLQKRSA